MKLEIIPVTMRDVQTVLTWRYPPPYDVYNPPSELSEADLAAMISPASPHFAVCDLQGELVAFVGVGHEAQVPGGDYAEPALDIGIGLRPELTGQGLGKLVLSQFFEYADSRFECSALRATIAAFNLRSQRTFLGLGFEETARFWTARDNARREWVIVMRRNPTPIQP